MTDDTWGLKERIRYPRYASLAQGIIFQDNSERADSREALNQSSSPCKGNLHLWREPFVRVSPRLYQKGWLPIPREAYSTEKAPTKSSVTHAFFTMISLARSRNRPPHPHFLPVCWWRRGVSLPSKRSQRCARPPPPLSGVYTCQPVLCPGASGRWGENARTPPLCPDSELCLLSPAGGHCPLLKLQEPRVIFMKSCFCNIYRQLIFNKLKFSDHRL